MTPSSVLVVEDDRELRELYANALTTAGYIVCAVEDGVDALRTVAERPPHLIVLDLALPRLGGHDVQRELASHAETRDIPIVVVTGTDVRRLSATDFDCILQKPVDLDVLIASVDRCLRDVRGIGPASAGSPQTDSRSWRRPRRRVLVVDDDVAMQVLLRHFLEEKAYQVTTAGAVGEAIGILEQQWTDAVVLDVRMPHRSGLELLEFIRLDERLRETPVLVLTGAALTIREKGIIDSNRGDLFLKSDDLESLAARLDALMVRGGR
jgi:DNA-binding response OmpR family regulator